MSKRAALLLIAFCALTSSANVGGKDEELHVNNLRGPEELQVSKQDAWSISKAPSRAQQMLDLENQPSDGRFIVHVQRGFEGRVLSAARLVHEAYRVGITGKKFTHHMSLTEQEDDDELDDDDCMVVEGIHRHDLEAIDNVLSVKPDLKVYASDLAWGIERIQHGDKKTVANRLTTYSPHWSGQGSDVYILDTGLDTTHSEFQAAGSTCSFPRTVANIFVSSDFPQYSDTESDTDGNSHGTHCAGITGGNTIGGAPCANIYGMKTLDDDGSGFTSGIIKALKKVRALHKQKGQLAKSVVSMSLGGPCGTAEQCEQDDLVKQVQRAINDGIPVVVAAGNDGGLASLSSPSAADAAITVGASDIYDEMPWWSNFGQQTDIIAPGVQIRSACSSNKAARSSLVFAKLVDKEGITLTNRAEYCADKNTYLVISGTSMACPLVAAVMAQQLQRVGNMMSMTDQHAVSKLNATVMCESANSLIPQSLRTTGDNTTTTNILQMAGADSAFIGCGLFELTPEPSANPTATPVPTVTPAPTFTPAPTRVPTIRTVVNNDAGSANMLSAGALAGIIIGGVVVALVVGMIAYFFIFSSASRIVLMVSVPTTDPSAPAAIEIFETTVVTTEGAELAL
jgi:subtilisin family serine protease